LTLFFGDECGQNYIKFVENTGLFTGELPKNFVDFLCAAPFQNQNASNATWVENRGQFSDFFTPVKIGGWINKMSKWIKQVQPI